MKDLKLGLNTMSPTVNFHPWGSGPDKAVEMVQHAEALGYDSVWTSEASGTDVISPLAYLAAKTTKIKLGTNIMQMAGRTPATTAMTAVTMDMLSGGRFILGLGVSGPAVVEGWHNLQYKRPVGRSREYIEIVREIIARRKPLEYHGEHFDIPYQKEGSTGLARPIKLMVRPRRPRIPLYLAAIGPNNVRLALEACDGLLTPCYSPFKEKEFLDDVLADWPQIEQKRADLSLGMIDVAPFVPIVVGDDVDRCIDKLRPTLAFWLGAMGPKTMNFYNRMACRVGYEKVATEIQELYWEGKRSEAAALVPWDMIDEISLCGPRERIRDRLEAWKESMVTTMIITAPDKASLTLMTELLG